MLNFSGSFQQKHYLYLGIQILAVVLEPGAGTGVAAGDVVRPDPFYVDQVSEEKRKSFGGGQFFTRDVTFLLT